MSTTTTTATTTIATSSAPSPLTSANPTPLLAQLQRDGFVIIRSAIPPAQVSALRRAAADATTLARAGKWPHLRTLPKAFPPWPADPSMGIWGVQHLLHPDLPSRDDFVRVYFSDAVIQPAMELMEIPPDREDRLVLELFNLLVRPDRDFDLRWHRDSVVFPSPTLAPADADAQEAAALGLAPLKTGWATTRRPYHAQYNIPLFTDASLQLVPGSHARPRTAVEREVLETSPRSDNLPGSITVVTEPGDILFYDNNIIHRGVYDSSVERLTLHATVGDMAGGDKRARNVLQHAVGAWIEDAHFDGLEDDRLRARAAEMKRKLIELGLRAGKGGELALHDD